MGKRSNFERNPRDFYETPEDAVLPLLPHLYCDLDHGTRFCEPCAGAGKLVDILTDHGLHCAMAWDIHPLRDDIDEQDATTRMIGNIDYHITNPPWDRKILHPIIENLYQQAPTWLLFDADWMHTKQSIPYMKWCVKVVSIGRVKWIPDSKMTGKDNCCWYLFDIKHTGPTAFYGRAE